MNINTKAIVLALLVVLLSISFTFSQKINQKNNFPVKGFHLDLDYTLLKSIRLKTQQSRNEYFSDGI